MEPIVSKWMDEQRIKEWTGQVRENYYQHKYTELASKYEDLLNEYEQLMEREHKLYLDIYDIKLKISTGDISEALSKIVDVTYRYRQGGVHLADTNQPVQVNHQGGYKWNR